jgi:type I restriction enzyme M protein
MNQNQLAAFAQLEADLWEAADQLRANSKLTSSEYCMPVLGVIFLRHAANRYEAATWQIEADQASGRMPRRPLIKDDYVRRRALYLPEEARHDWIMSLPKEEDMDQALIDVMTAIEEDVLGTLRGHLEAFRKYIEAGDNGDAEQRRLLVEAMSELGDASGLNE